MFIKLNETTASLRRIPFHAVDATDGITPETALSGTGYFSKNGATSVTSINQITEIDATNMPGRYYIEADATEVATEGFLEFRYKDPVCAEVIARAYVGNLPADINKIDGDYHAAKRMRLSALAIVSGTAVAGTLTTTQMSVDLLETTDVHYLDRVLVWTSGVLKDIAVRISNYDGTSTPHVVSYTTIPTGESPSGGDTFIII